MREKSPSSEKLDVDKLVCYGCCHSSGLDSFPGIPSGERPCQFCIRNKMREDPPLVAKWYDGSDPVYVPMDCYQSLDMHEQWSRRIRNERGEPGFIRYRNGILP